MANDEVKIILDSPPAQPFDVEINPDSPPAAPFDVEINPDSPPAVPFDVKTTPDTGPVGPFDVEINPDSPPAGPFDVATTPDSPPQAPFQVGVSYDGPPALPVDVPVQPDGPPNVPFDVVTNVDEPPGVPFDVITTPDSPPFEPNPRDHRHDSVRDLPPAEPFDVPIKPSALPAAPPSPLDIPITRSAEPALPTIQTIIDSVAAIDTKLANFLNQLIPGFDIFVSQQAGGALNPVTLARWFRDYTSSVGAGGVAKFIAEQTVLYSMNPVVARVFNPAYFQSMLIPGSMGHVHTTIDTMSGATYDKFAQVVDEKLQFDVQTDSQKPVPHTPMDENVYSRENKISDAQNFSIDGMLDATVSGDGYQFLKYDEQNRVRVFDSSQYFESQDKTGAQKLLGRSRVLSENIKDTGLARSNATNGIIRSSFANEDKDGAVYSKTQNPSNVVDDDEARVPLSFTDLRKDPIKNAYRSVYFRPLNLSFSQAFAPEYNESNSFGRIDPTIGYVRTTRTISISFDVHTFAIEDLRNIYNKMVILTSMVYPTYGADSVLRSGPVVRMRIGDAVSTDAGGSAGVIKSLNFDFADALWELQRGMKVPRSYKVSLEFTVLHDGPIGVMNGQFGVFKLPANTAAGKDTNPAGSADSVDGMTETAQIIPGMFSAFGEPRKR